MVPQHVIEIADSQDCLPIDAEVLEDIIRTVLVEEEVAGAEISVAIVDNPTIHELNRQYLEHDYETDVLSFLLECDPEPTPDEEVPRGRGKRIEGEIIVSAEMAKQSAADFSWSPWEEFVLYVVHGLLHLAGYDDLSDSEREIMQSREQQMLSLCGMPQIIRKIR